MNSIFNEDRVARLKFHNQFPYGYILIPSSTANLLCGLHALRASLGAHGPGLFPTVQQLLDIWNSSHITECEAETGLDARDNNNNFYIDQLAVILQILGRQNGLDLQLGYILADTRAFLFPTPTLPDTRIIWIRSTSTTGADGDIQHFEGIRGPPNPASHDYSSTSSEDDDMTDETGSEDTATDAGNSPSRLSEHSHLPNCQGAVFPSIEDPQAEFVDIDEALWRKCFL
jgi:hypothetical protein